VPSPQFFCVGQAEILRAVHIAILISVDAAQHIWRRDVHPREILLVGAEHFGGSGSLDALSPEPDVIDGPVIPSLVSRCPPLHLLLERSDFGSCICSRAQVSAKPVLSI
jgi:hypothetical protein